MRMTKLLAAAGALSLATAPVLAQAAGHAVPSRSASDVSAAESLHGGSAWVAILALAAVIIGIIAATSSNHDNLPHSP